MISILFLFLAILVHEIGHYIVARSHGITPQTVCIFFNPGFSIIRFQAGGTTWCIGWLPLGGYTDLPGWQYLYQNKQFDIAIAGIVFNCIAAFLCFVYGVPGQLAAINLAIAAISLLPWSPYDGSYIFQKKIVRKEEWVIKEVQCNVCDHVWKALCLEDTSKLECPSCRETNTFKTIQSDPLKNYKSFNNDC